MNERDVRSQANPVKQSVAEDGLASRFECRPEFLFYNLPVFRVLDASTVRERSVDDLKVVHIPHVFAGKDEIFLGFGKPNAYLVCPDGKGGYQKFAGKSLKRAPSVVQDTRNFVQSGILFRFRNLPPDAAEALRKAMDEHNGIKYWTCVNACLRVMERAGFACGDRPLSSLYLPYSLMKHLLRYGLTFQGKPVEFQVIRTSPQNMEQYTREIIGAELSTFRRHFNRAVDARAKKSWSFAAIAFLLHAPGRLVTAVIGQKPGQRVTGPVAPALPDSQEYSADLRVRVSTASFLGTLLRQIWGPHALFEAQQQRVHLADYLSTPLTAFPQKNPSLPTRIKKRVLFARPVIWLIRKLLVPKYAELGITNERHVYDMLRTHSEQSPNKYNLVLTGAVAADGTAGDSRVIIARTTVKSKLVDWVLSKHVLMSGYDPAVGFAGELWKDADGIIHVSGNSGTYRPTNEDVQAAVAFLQAVFPHLRFVAELVPTS
jgi:hypothetical protein